MPMNTRFVTRPTLSFRSRSALDNCHTWAKIRPFVRFCFSPATPLAQNRQPTGQPT